MLYGPPDIITNRTQARFVCTQLYIRTAGFPGVLVGRQSFSIVARAGTMSSMHTSQWVTDKIL